MEYNDQDYLNLFTQIKQENNQQIQTKDFNYEQLRGNAYAVNEPMTMLRETPDYNNYNRQYTDYSQQNINEVQRQNYSQDYNINEFNIETRINGQSINEVKRQGREDRLNEIMESRHQERLNEVMKTQEVKSINETVSFSDVDYVSLEMFEKARYNSMMQVASRIIPR